MQQIVIECLKIDTKGICQISGLEFPTFPMHIAREFPVFGPFSLIFPPVLP